MKKNIIKALASILLISSLSTISLDKVNISSSTNPHENQADNLDNEDNVGSLYDDSEFEQVLNNARKGVKFYTDTYQYIEDRETGELLSETQQYTKEVRTPDYLSQSFLTGFKGEVIESNKQAFITRYQETAGLSLSMGKDGQVYYSQTATNFDYTYPFAFDLVGEKDFIVDTENNTATIINGASITYYFMSTFAYLNLYTFSIQPLTFHYSDESKSFTSCEFTAYDDDVSGGIKTTIDFYCEFAPLLDEDIYLFEELEDNTTSKELDQKIQKTKEILNEGNYTIRTEVVEGTEGATGIQSAKYYYTDDLLAGDTILYNQNYGEYYQFLFDAGSTYYAGYLPLDSSIKPNGTTSTLSKDVAHAPFDFSGKLFEEYNENCYKIKDTRFLTDGSIIASMLPPIDNYGNALSNGLMDLYIYTDEEKVTGFRLISYITNYQEKFVVDYYLEDIGSTVVPQEIKQAADTISPFYKAMDPTNLTDVTISYVDEGQEIQVAITEDKAKITTDGIVTAYYQIEPYSATIDRLYEYTCNDSGVWSKRSRGNYHSIANGLCATTTLEFPTTNDFINYGSINDNNIHIAVSATETYDMILNETGKLISLHHIKGTSKDIVYTLTYGPIEDFEVPVV